jgi:hypothetical protein
MLLSKRNLLPINLTSMSGIISSAILLWRRRLQRWLQQSLRLQRWLQRRRRLDLPRPRLLPSCILLLSEHLICTGLVPRATGRLQREGLWLRRPVQLMPGLLVGLLLLQRRLLLMPGLLIEDVSRAMPMKTGPTSLRSR